MDQVWFQSDLNIWPLRTVEGKKTISVLRQLRLIVWPTTLQITDGRRLLYAPAKMHIRKCSAGRVMLMRPNTEQPVAEFVFVEGQWLFHALD